MASSDESDDVEAKMERKKAVLRDVVKICKAELHSASASNATSSSLASSPTPSFSPEFARALAETVMGYVEVFAKDMEAFAKHAGRSQVR